MLHKFFKIKMRTNASALLDKYTEIKKMNHI
uniref:Uncharacterized protein n=1 Tax=Anguilla anguilla TaxID=7936 RepID=A0A0E9R8Q2_ANGAN